MDHVNRINVITPEEVISVCHLPALSSIIRSEAGEYNRAVANV